MTASFQPIAYSLQPKAATIGLLASSFQHLAYVSGEGDR